MDPNNRLIASISRDTLLNGNVRYGMARNVPAEDERGKPCLIALVVIERDNGSIQTIGINEARIAFHGDKVIKEEIMKAVFQ